MKIMRLFIPAIIVLAMTACGGGSSSGGGGSSGGADAVYTGTATLNARAPGIPPISESGGFTITISGRNVTVSDGQTSGTAPLSADGASFIVPIPVTVTQSGVTCTINFIFNGTISGSTASGPVTGGGSCRGPGGSVPVTISGSFTTTTGTAKSRSGSALSDTVRAVIENVQ